ncbi:phospholipase A2 inhibitor NAI-like [Spea bombifrons]|uniref:phospholipase A2 inhibitor NAI-like n=1 Tax=Spea bombifrons TaxID=233779 RepID=UPI00234B8E33|nr:phospholipase A2 inhibitor NAI-like [Spea bombifrons]
MNNTAPYCTGSAQNCSLPVCMSTLTRSSTAKGGTVTEFERSCGRPNRCHLMGSMTSYSVSTATNSTCCSLDLCNPPVPTLPTQTNKMLNGVQCKTCFAHNNQCPKFDSINCTGEETFCVEYDVAGETGSTTIWGCSSESFCHSTESRNSVSGKVMNITTKCSRSGAEASIDQSLWFLAVLMLGSKFL